MRLNEVFTRKKILFLVLFSVLALIGYQINFSSVIGADAQYFTLFQFFGPIAGAFLGPVVGATSVLLAEAGNFALTGKTPGLVNVMRLAPMLFAALYFGTRIKSVKGNLSAIIPLVCMGLFMLHPIGGSVWFYSLYWLIPLAAKFFPKRLFLRSLGATFTAHAIGSTLWLYTVPMPAEAWLLLIPVVAAERILFAAGISVSYVGFTTLLARLENFIPGGAVSVDKNYVLSRKLFSLRA